LLKDAKIGELIYIPSNVVISKSKSGAIEDYRTTKVPLNVLVAENKDDKVGIFYEGEVWYIKKKDAYGMIDE